MVSSFDWANCFNAVLVVVGGTDVDVGEVLSVVVDVVVDGLKDAVVVVVVGIGLCVVTGLCGLILFCGNLLIFLKLLMGLIARGAVSESNSSYWFLTALIEGFTVVDFKDTSVVVVISPLVSVSFLSEGL